MAVTNEVVEQLRELLDTAKDSGGRPGLDAAEEAIRLAEEAGTPKTLELGAEAAYAPRFEFSAYLEENEAVREAYHEAIRLGETADTPGGWETDTSRPGRATPGRTNGAWRVNGRNSTRSAPRLQRLEFLDRPRVVLHQPPDSLGGL